MDEVLKSLRRIYYGVIGVSTALLAFALTAPRAKTYQLALAEINALRDLPWQRLPHELIQSVGAKQKEGLTIFELSKTVAPGWLVTRLRFTPTNLVHYEMDSVPTSVGGLAGFIERNPSVRISLPDTSQETINQLHTQIMAFCSQQSRGFTHHLYPSPPIAVRFYYPHLRERSVGVCWHATPDTHRKDMYGRSFQRVVILLFFIFLTWPHPETRSTFNGGSQSTTPSLPSDCLGII